MKCVTITPFNTFPQLARDYLLQGLIGNKFIGEEWQQAALSPYAFVDLEDALRFPLVMSATIMQDAIEVGDLPEGSMPV